MRPGGNGRRGVYGPRAHGGSESIGFQRKLNPKCERLDDDDDDGVLFVPEGLLSSVLMGPESIGGGEGGGAGRPEQMESVRVLTYRRSAAAVF